MKRGTARLFPAALACGFLLFGAVHSFYDPYRAEPVAGSRRAMELEPGGRPETLAVVEGGEPGDLYRITARVDWRRVRTGDAGWKSARVIFAGYDAGGRWIPAPHCVFWVTGSGRRTFHRVLALPERAVSTRLVFQHLGSRGSVRLRGYSLERVTPRRSRRVVFPVLQAGWVLLAGWSVRRLGLFLRPGGRAVFLAGALIAAGMALPGPLVSEAPGWVADWVRAAEEPVRAEPPPGAADRPPSAPRPPAEDIGPEPAPPGLFRRTRNLAASSIRRLDPFFWGHAGLFLLLGAAAGACFPGSRREDRLRLFAGGLLYAAAAELLQVTELTRTVRASDIGVNALGWTAGLLVRFLRPPRPGS